jgi:hypothetical protein
MFDAALKLAGTTTSKPIFEHSLRSFYYARLTAELEGTVNDAAYDEGLLFAATVMHDLGLGTLAESRARFEVEGADLASALLADHGVSGGDIDRVWEAIALHSSIGLANRMGLLTYLTHKGVFIDAGRFEGLPEHVTEPIRVAYPRQVGDRSIPDAVLKHARRSPAEAAPPFSFAAGLLMQAGGIKESYV